MIMIMIVYLYSEKKNLMSDVERGIIRFREYKKLIKPKPTQNQLSRINSLKEVK